MDPTPSLSQGVFIDRPKGGKHKADRLAAKCFGAFEPPQETIEFRRSLYKTYFNKVKESVTALESEWNEHVTEQVCDFIREATITVANNEMVTPLGFVPTGFCAEETVTLFDSVQSDLRSQVSLIARVESTKCPNVKLGFQNICKQLIQNNLNASYFHDLSGIDMDDDDTFMDDSSAETSRSSRYISIHDLQKWYQSQCPTYFENPLVGDSPSLRGLRTPKRLEDSNLLTASMLGTPKSGNQLYGRRIRKGRNTQTIVIILENADYFPNNVVSQLLKVLSSAKLPLVFLLGVNQCLADINRFLPKSSSTTFIHKTFKTYSTQVRLKEVIKTILGDPDIPFKLSPAILNFLTSYMINQHFSIARFLQSYKICILDHFRTAESVFCVSYTERSKWPLETLKVSCKSLASSQNNRKGKPLSTSSSYEDRVNESYRELQQWLLMLHVLHITEKHLLSSPISFPELYIACGSGDYFDSSEDTSENKWDRIFARIQKLKKVGLADLIDELYDDIEKVYISKDKKRSDRNRSEYKKDIEDFIMQLDDFKNRLKDSDSKEASLAKSPKSPAKSVRLQAKMKKEDLQKALLEKIAKNSEESPEYATFKTEFCTFFQKQTKKILKPLKNLSNSQIFIYDNLSVMKTLFSPSPELLISHSLKMPGKILNCDCCKETPCHSVHESLPDVCIVYKILMEQVSKKVNLNIIYQSFSSVIEAGPISVKGRKSTSKMKQESSDLHLVRFRQAVAELQHVGILKRSKSKPDEITKLVWHM